MSHQNPDLPTGPKTSWSIDEDRILLAMIRQGQRRSAIAARFACSEEDVAARFQILAEESEKEEQAAKQTTSLNQIQIDPMMADLLKDHPAFEVLFTLLCGKFNEQGVLLRHLSEMLSTSNDTAEQRLAECLFGSLSIRVGGMEEELLKTVAEQVAKDIATNFQVIPKTKLKIDIQNGK